MSLTAPFLRISDLGLEEKISTISGSLRLDISILLGLAISSSEDILMTVSVTLVTLPDTDRRIVSISTDMIVELRQFW